MRKKGKQCESTTSQQSAGQNNSHNQNSDRGRGLAPETEISFAGMMVVNVPGGTKHQHQQGDGEQKVNDFDSKSPGHWIPSIFEGLSNQ